MEIDIIRCGRCMKLDCAMCRLFDENEKKQKIIGEEVRKREEVKKEYLNNFYDGNIDIKVSSIQTEGDKLDIKTGNGKMGIYLLNNQIYSGGYLNTSDRRIKKNIEDINDLDALEKIRMLKPKMYEYVDVEMGGTAERVYGFIAQEVGEAIPNAVRISKNYIPNVMIRGQIIRLGNTEDEILCMESIEDKIRVGDKIRVRGGSGEWVVDVNEIRDIQRIKVSKNGGDDVDVMIIGKEIDDFYYLRKDAIFTLGIGAIQDMDRSIERDKKRIEELERRVEELSNIIGRIVINNG